MNVINGKTQGIPLSLSRWTDVCGSQNKWEWFMAQMKQGHMMAFDPRTAVPGHWSLKPEETLGMVFWTKNPLPLIRDKEAFAGHKIKVHVTVTGWEEVEKGAPNLVSGALLLGRAAEVFGPENVTWRFSPVPVVKDAVERFTRIARLAYTSGVDKVFVSFLQENDRVAETRSREDRLDIMLRISEIADSYGIKVFLCNEDSLLAKVNELPKNLSTGVCQPPEDFSLPGNNVPPSEGCGCVLLADPFTINESCSYGCTYCYAADKTLADKKHNTTKSLPVVR